MPIKKDTKATKLSKNIQKNIHDLTDVIIKNLDENDESMLAAYSALVSLMYYFDFRLRDRGTTEKIISEAKENAEEYVLELISEELGAYTQKKGNA